MRRERNEPINVHDIYALHTIYYFPLLLAGPSTSRLLEPQHGSDSQVGDNICLDYKVNYVGSIIFVVLQRSDNVGGIRCLILAILYLLHSVIICLTLKFFLTCIIWLLVGSYSWLILVCPIRSRVMTICCLLLPYDGHGRIYCWCFAATRYSTSP